MPQIQQLEQRTDAWLEARKGKITASLAAACIGLDPHKGPMTAWKEIMGLSKQPENRDMAWGTQFEAEGRRAYEVETGNLVQMTGFWVHDKLGWLGASPDGLIDADGLAEIKCPRQIPEAVPAHYEIQMRVQLACTGRSWCDFFAWARPCRFLARVERDEAKEIDLLLRLEDFYFKYIKANVEPPRRNGRKTIEAANP